MDGSLWPRLLAILMLGASNLFMTFAWCWRLKFKSEPQPKVVLISWLIAVLGYVIAVPANRLGSAVYSPPS